MLKIQRTVNGRETVFRLSGQMHAESAAELKALFTFGAKARIIVLDLKDLTLVDREAVRFLERFESNSIKLMNCPLYIREWILRERKAK